MQTHKETLTVVANAEHWTNSRIVCVCVLWNIAISTAEANPNELICEYKLLQHKQK